MKAAITLTDGEVVYLYKNVQIEKPLRNLSYSNTNAIFTLKKYAFYNKVYMIAFHFSPCFSFTTFVEASGSEQLSMARYLIDAALSTIFV